MTTTTRNANNRSFARTITAAAAVATLAGLAAPANAQMFQRLDGTQDNERSYEVKQTRDAGYVTVGSVESIDPLNGVVDEDIYVIKHRKDGSVEWRTRYGGNRRDRGTSIDQTEDGGYIVAAHTESAGSGLGLALVRLDPLGGVMWAHAYEASSFESVINPAEAAYYLQPAVRESRDTGDYVVVTNVRNAVGGQFPVFLRTDPGGFPMVNVSYIDPTRGDATFAGFTDLKELNDGTIGITGFWADADPADTGAPFILDIDILAMRAAPDGAPFWVSRYDEFSPNLLRTFEAGHGIDVTDKGDMFAIGAIAERTDPTGAPASVGTDHLLLDSFTGTVLAAHYLDQMTPAYAATLFNRDQFVLTSGIDLSGGIAGAAFGPGSAVLLFPGLPAVARYNTYGPGSNFPEKLESIAITDLTCGYAMTGPKTHTLGLGGSDQLLVKVNDDWESGCYESKLAPNEFNPEFQQIQMDLVEQHHDNWAAWGNQRSWDTNENVLCFEKRCKPCPVDFNGDGVVDNGDIGAFIALFIAGDMAADMNGDGILDNGDISAFIAAFLAGC